MKTKKDFITQFLATQRKMWRLLQEGNEEMIDRLVDMDVKIPLGKGRPNKKGKLVLTYLFANWDEYIDNIYAYNKETFEQILAATEKNLKMKEWKFKGI